MNQRICSFYVSDEHLLTILLPYINEKILEEKEINLILQKDLSEHVKIYLKNVKSLNLLNEKILKLNWKKSKVTDVKCDELFVVGEYDFINKINDELDSEKIEEIVNCYDISLMENINKVMDNYNTVLNSQGKKMLIKNSQNEQKRKTIKSQI